MDKKTLRKLNDQLNNAQARLNRAHLAAELAEIEVRHLKNSISEAVTKFRGNLTDPLYDVYIASGGNNKIQVIKAVRQLQMEAGMPYGLKEAKDIVDAAGSSVASSTFFKGVNFTLVEHARKLISEAGGVAEARSAS